MKHLQNGILQPIRRGKIELIAESDGLFQVDEERLLKVNSLPEMIATRRADFPVKGDKLAGTRVIPLVIEKEKMEEAKKKAAGSSRCWLDPYKNKKAGIVTTGNEVFYGRIEDKFGRSSGKSFRNLVWKFWDRRL